MITAAELAAIQPPKYKAGRWTPQVRDYVKRSRRGFTSVHVAKKTGLDVGKVSIILWRMANAGEIRKVWQEPGYNGMILWERV